MEFEAGVVTRRRFIPASEAYYAVPSVDPATLAWVSAVVGNGGTVSAARQSLVDALIAGLRADGVWSKLDRLWVFAAENSASALTDMVADSLATAVNSPTFTTDRGYNTNGSASMYVDTNFTSGTNYTQDAAHASIWQLSDPGTVNPMIYDGAPSGTNFNFYPNAGGTQFWRLNANAGGAFTVADGVAFHLGNRTSSTNTDGYRNGASLGSSSSTSTGLPAAGLRLGIQNDGQFAEFSAGGTLSSTDASNLYSRLRTYMTAVGVP